VLIHVDMLPALIAAKGLVHVVKPLPVGAALTPAVALAYAQSLIEAAARAEGDQLIEADRAGGETNRGLRTR
jgi:hypothetical protein